MTHMTLTLVAASLNEQPLSQPITAVFDSRGGTIGRADHNTMTLPDPQRHVSRLQAEIVLHGREYLIRNVGAANPIMVGSRTLAHGELAPVQEDELIRIGGYLLKARLGDAPVPQPGPGLSALAPVPSPAVVMSAAAPVVAPPPAGPLVVPPPAVPAAAAPAMPSADPFADLLGPVATATPAAGRATPASVDPFADLLGPPSTAPASAVAAASDPFADLMPPPAGVHARSAAVAPPAPAAARLPDDFDPFATPSSPLPTPEASPAPADPFADLMGGGPGPSIDALFGLGSPATASPVMSADDPLAGFMAQAQSMAPAPGADPSLPGMSTDPLALFGAGAMAAPPPPAQPAQPDQLAAVHAAWQPPAVPVPLSAAPPPVFVPAPTAPVLPVTSAADAAALWAAFCQGAGIDVRVPPHEVAERLHEVGRILRSAVDGTLQLVAVRASTKHELRAGVTVIQQRDNNPLKFTPDARSALEQLLQPPLRGFLEGPAAMDDAMHDLVGHAIGSVAGLRAAVEGMLDRFAPEALASKLSDGSFIDNLLPMNRKARLWDLYLQHNQAIREEAQEDFHTLFGKAFVAAYQQQIERLQREGAGRP